MGRQPKNQERSVLWLQQAAPWLETCLLHWPRHGGQLGPCGWDGLWTQSSPMLDNHLARGLAFFDAYRSSAVTLKRGGLKLAYDRPSGDWPELVSRSVLSMGHHGQGVSPDHGGPRCLTGGAHPRCG